MQESGVGVSVGVGVGVGDGDAGGGGGTAIPRGGAKQGTTRGRTCYVRYIRRKSNEYTETDGRPRGPELRSRAKSVGGAQSTLSQYILCHRVTQNTESSECGPATEGTSGYVDTRTTRANVDERLEATEAKLESQVEAEELRQEVNTE